MMERLARLQDKRERGEWLNPWEMLQLVGIIAALAFIALPLYLHMSTNGQGIIGQAFGLAGESEVEQLRRRVAALEAEKPQV